MTTTTTTLPNEFYPATEEAILAVGRRVPVNRYKFSDFKKQMRANEVLIMLLDSGISKKLAYIVSDEYRYAMHKQRLDSGYALSCEYYFVPENKITTQVVVSVMSDDASNVKIMHLATDA